MTGPYDLASPPRQAVQLPHKLSELAQIALRDLEACERRPDAFEIDMDLWFCPIGTAERPKCAVCAAGAVMAQTLGADINSTHSRAPRDFGEHNSLALRVVDHLRLGWVGVAASTLGDCVEGLDRKLPPYQSSPEAFKDGMRALIADLKKAGL